MPRTYAAIIYYNANVQQNVIQNKQERGGGAYIGWRMRTAESPADYTSRGWNDNIRGRTNWIQRHLIGKRGAQICFIIDLQGSLTVPTARLHSSLALERCRAPKNVGVCEREREKTRWEFGSVMPNTVDYCNKAFSLEVERV